MPETPEFVTGPGSRLPMLVLLHHMDTRPEASAALFTGLLDGLPALPVVVLARAGDRRRQFFVVSARVLSGRRLQARLLAAEADRLAAQLADRRQGPPLIVTGACQLTSRHCPGTACRYRREHRGHAERTDIGIRGIDIPLPRTTRYL